MLGRGCSAPPLHPRCKMLFSALVLWLGWWWQQLHHVGEALLPSEPAACQLLGRQEGSKMGGKVLLVFGLRKDSTLRDALV